MIINKLVNVYCRVKAIYFAVSLDFFLDAEDGPDVDVCSVMMLFL